MKVNKTFDPVRIPPGEYIEVDSVRLSVWTEETIAAATDKANIDREMNIQTT